MPGSGLGMFVTNVCEPPPIPAPKPAAPPGAPPLPIELKLEDEGLSNEELLIS